MIFASFLSLLCLLAGVCFINYSILHRRRRAARGLPLGPPPLPLIGNIHQLSRNKPHQSLCKLAKTYGPLIQIKIGFVDVIVVSSPELAKQVLQTHDHALSGRPSSEASLSTEGSIFLMPAGDEWRALRKLCKDQMFSSQKLDASQGLRRTKLEDLKNYVHECCDRGQVLDFFESLSFLKFLQFTEKQELVHAMQVVDIADSAFTISLNLISNSLFSMDIATFSSDNSQEIRELIHDIMQMGSAPNLADYFLFLKSLDPQGLKRKAEVLVGKLFKIFNEIIDQRLESKESQLEKNDLLKILLEINRRNEGDFNRNNMLYLFIDLFIAGADTTGTVVEWAMVELIQNPIKMMKARKELKSIVGEKRQVEESDIPNLPYLEAILKETFRLHPVAPLLTPHKAEADVEINGYKIPKNRQILVNVWAIGRDSSIWPDPDLFEPERFLDMKIDLRGQDFELIPFGSGRRMCPGIPWALRLVPVVLATLIKDFNWKFNEKMNMEETLEFVLHKAVPLKAFPIKLTLSECKPKLCHV